MIRYDVSSLRPRIIIKIIIRNVSSGCNWESLREAKMIKQTLFEIERCISKRIKFSKFYQMNVSVVETIVTMTRIRNNIILNQ